jgi:hypothetical protein
MLRRKRPPMWPDDGRFRIIMQQAGSIACAVRHDHAGGRAREVVAGSERLVGQACSLAQRGKRQFCGAFDLGARDSGFSGHGMVRHTNPAAPSNRSHLIDEQFGRPDVSYRRRRDLVDRAQNTAPVL